MKKSSHSWQLFTGILVSGSRSSLIKLVAFSGSRILILIHVLLNLWLISRYNLIQVMGFTQFKVSSFKFQYAQTTHTLNQINQVIGQAQQQFNQMGQSGQQGQQGQQSMLQ